MIKGRSTYTFQLNCDPNVANKLIQDFLVGYNFILLEEKGEKFYRNGEANLEGFKFFNYYIDGQTLTIQAWLKGLFSDIIVEQNDNNNIQALNYRKLLLNLFQEIDNLNLNQNVNSDVQNQPSLMPQNNKFAESFKNDMNKRQEKMCESGFWLSIFGLILTFVNISFGALIYIMNLYFASQGLKTKKRGKAITTFIITIISIIISIFKLL